MADKDNDLHLNDPAHTASREAHSPAERREAAEEPLEVQEKKSKVAAGAASGVGGAVAGAASGILVGGPIGAAIGAIAGAVGGWWVGHASVVAGDWTDHDEAYYREHHEELRTADRTFEMSRPAYHLGHIASRNPDYRDRRFDEIEPDLRSGWTDELRETHGTWDAVREQVRTGYERPRGGTASERSVSGRHNISAHEPRASGGDGLRSPHGTGY